MRKEFRGKKTARLRQTPPQDGREPIAIIGIGCRFPGGADDADSFWRLLCEGVDAITEVPAERWNMDKFYDPDPNRPGKSYARHGGFIQGIDLFDPEFFGISNREAARMDPQQRLLLEVAWEALEDGGQAIDRRKPNDAGVFIGISSWDYSKVESSLWEMDTLNSHTGTGLALSIAANRISHVLNLTGPSLAIDTACSSSLVAVDLACKSLWNGECRTALAGGVNVILNPESYVIYCRLNMLSPDGRCKAFDAAGNGFVKSEGAGVVVLKPLSRALKDRDPIYALIRGSRVNQDGHTPGITVPSRESQERLLKQVYEQAQVSAADVTYFEAHGPGTRVGDPIEARAIGRVLGENRPPGHNIFLGSVKTNIGHLEAAAGIAGLIKTALVIKNRMIPPNLHFKEPNPDIDFQGLGLKIPLALSPWPAGRPVLASVNSFGFGGTNAHVLLSAAPEAAAEKARPAESPPRDCEVFVLSAHNKDSLLACARSVRKELSGPSWKPHSLLDICRTAALRRVHHPYRLSFAARSKEQLASQIDAILSGETGPGISSGQALPSPKLRTALVFSGQGPQWWAMGRELFRKEPVYRDIILRCHQILSAFSDWSLLDELNAGEKNSRLDKTAIAQPSIFALQAALTALWESWGIHPQAVVGHSVGEVAAAYTAGVLSLEDALLVIYHRGRSMDRASSEGKMLAAGLSAGDALTYLKGKEESIALAAINSPDSVTFSGDAEVLEEIKLSLNADGVFARFLPINYAFHSHHMEGLRDDLSASLKDIKPRPPRLRVYSTVSGRPAGRDDFGPEYWWKNVRQTVNFAAAIEGLLDEDVNVFIEISPNPALSSAITESLLRRDRRGWVLPSLRRKDPEHMSMLSSLGTLFTLGARPDWSALFPEPGPVVRFPRYSWSHEPCWHQADDYRSYIHGPCGNPLLGARLPAPAPAWENQINAWMLRYLKDHRIQGQILLPGTAFIEMALAVARSVTREGPAVLENIKFQKAVSLSGSDDVCLHTDYDPDGLTFQIQSRQGDSSAAWQLNASGRILPPFWPKKPTESLKEIFGRLKVRMDAEACYGKFYRSGIEYGPGFRGIRQMFCGAGESLAEIVVPASLENDIHNYEFHPAILDACLQAIVGGCSLPETKSYLPVSIDKIHILHPPSFPLWSHVREARTTGDILEASLRVLDAEGRILADIQGIRCRGMEQSKIDESPDVDKMFHMFRWIPRDLEGKPVSAGLEKPWPRRAQILKEGRTFAASLEVSPEPEGFGDLAAAFVINSFLKLGWIFSPGERFTLEKLCQSLGFSESQLQLAATCLRILEEKGWVRAAGNGFLVRARLSPSDARAGWRRLWTECPAWNPVLLFLEKCGESLAEILQGKIKPQEWLTSGGDASALEQLFRDSPPWRNANLLVHHTIHETIDRLPGRHRLRILEIGAGAAGLAPFLLPMLGEYDAEYTITDASGHGLEKLRAAYRGYPFVSFQAFDIRKTPDVQGLTSGSFDLVLVNRTLGRARDLRAGLKNSARLVASRGLLFAVEPVRTAAWSELILALAAEADHLRDTSSRPRHDPPSLSRWKSIFSESGLSKFGCIPAGPDPGSCHEALLIGQVSRRRLEKARETAAAPGSMAREGWLIFNDRKDRGRRLAALLEEAGARCILVAPDEADRRPGRGERGIIPGSREHINELVSFMTSGIPGVSFKGIVHFWNLDVPRSEGVKTEDIHGLIQRSCLSVLHLVQELEARGGEWPRLFLVTRGAQAVDRKPEEVSPFQTAVWGLGRVIMNEFPQAHCRLIDLGRSDGIGNAEIQSVFRELGASEEDDEIAFRGPERYVHRLAKIPLARSQAPRSASSLKEENRYRLETSRPGVLSNLVIRRFETRPLEDSEIEIQVHAAGLNFSDVMKALNLYPGLPEGLIPLGIECAGVVSRVGKRVKRFRPGDRVYALAKSCFGSHTAVIRQGVMHMPPHLGFAEAATIPIAFLTATYGLVHAAKLRKGERVLIHSATGGVGLAAIQVARTLGAEVFATAGTEERRRLLRELGVEHVMDSRSLDFAQEIMDRTRGQGVDVILNSLSGEAIAKGLSVLRDSGRFIEIGKRDIHQDRRVGLHPFKNNLSFHAVDLDKIIRERPDLTARLLKAISEKVGKRVYRPLPFRAFPLSMAAEAFRHMAQAKHVGKVVLTVGDHHHAVAWHSLPVRFEADATYLITGGFGGFGLLVAKWMAANGARHLALMGRRGPVSDEAITAVRDIEKKNVRLLIVKGNVARTEDVAAALDAIRVSMPPLRGVVHAAMVLEDRILSDLDQERLERVIDPKVMGAWNLHLLTRGCPLDFFVLFSSMASLIGSPGQGNYVTANAFLDGFSHYRRSLGLPSLAINWGYLAEVGVAARREKIAGRFNAIGLKSFSPEQALDALGRLLRLNPVEMGVMNMDWEHWKEIHGRYEHSAKYAYLAGNDGQGQSPEAMVPEGTGLRQSLTDIPADKRPALLESRLSEQVAKILGASASRLDMDKPLTEHGFDSLMAIELRNWVDGNLKISLPTMEIMRGPSIRQLTQRLLDFLARASAAPS